VVLEGRQFFILTDHKPLTFALTRASDAWSARQQRQLAAIAEYTTDIRHVAGTENVIADALSRPPIAAAVEPAPGGKIDYAAFARDQVECEDTLQLQHSSTLRVLHVYVEGHNLLCDVSTGSPRLLVPRRWRQAVFWMLHGLSHPGVKATKRLVAARFVWRGCATDVAEWCRRCPGCARGKLGGTLETPAAAIPIPEERFSHVHVDIVGPLPAAESGHTHLLMVIDRTTRWPEAFPLAAVTAKECADTFLSGWVARFGGHGSSLQTEACNLPLPRGPSCAARWGLSTSPQQHTTPRAMGWWNGCIGS
jgi:Integrase zinc binding domain